MTREELNINPIYRAVIEQVKAIEDPSKLDYSNEYVGATIIERQKTFSWVRLYLNNECEDLKSGDVITIHHKYHNETIESFFSFYDKVNNTNKEEDNIKSYIGEDDKKVLCLMVEVEELERSNKTYMKTIIRGSKFFSPDIIRNSDIEITNTRTGQVFDFYMVSF